MTENKEHGRRAATKNLEGIGQASYWLGHPMEGILYVLKNDRNAPRISFGGPGSANDKLAKSARRLRKKHLGSAINDIL